MDIPQGWSLAASFSLSVSSPFCSPLCETSPSDRCSVSHSSSKDIDRGRALSQSGRVRVLLINQAFHPDPQATSRYSSRLADELVKRGHTVTVLTGRRDYDDPARHYPARETWRGVEIIRVWNMGLGYGTKAGRLLDFLTFHVSAFLRGSLLRRSDVVVALTSPPLVSILGAVWAWLWRARFIYWVMDLNPDEAIGVGWLQADGLAARFLEAASRWSLRRADRVIVLDGFMRDRVAGKGVDREKVDVIPLWMQDEAAFDSLKREQFRHEHHIEKNFVVMYAGNHTPCHPLDTLIGAAQLLREEARIRFAFVGFGLDWARLSDRARAESWNNTMFLPYQPLATGLLSAADAQVIVMGDAFVGIIHPCKIYNILAAQRPLIYIGPEQSHVIEIIVEAELGEVASSFRHGASRAVAEELQRRAREAAAGKRLEWPAKERLARWTESVILEKIVRRVENSPLPF
jgi:colanic acid biosynthesis glycosyl transferase WcaI